MGGPLRVWGVGGRYKGHLVALLHGRLELESELMGCKVTGQWMRLWLRRLWMNGEGILTAMKTDWDGSRKGAILVHWVSRMGVIADVLVDGRMLRNVGGNVRQVSYAGEVKRLWSGG